MIILLILIGIILFLILSVGLIGLYFLWILVKGLKPDNELQWKNFIGQKIREILISKGVIKNEEIGLRDG